MGGGAANTPRSRGWPGGGPDTKPSRGKNAYLHTRVSLMAARLLSAEARRRLRDAAPDAPPALFDAAGASSLLTAETSETSLP